MIPSPRLNYDLPMSQKYKSACPNASQPLKKLRLTFLECAELVVASPT